MHNEAKVGSADIAKSLVGSVVAKDEQCEETSSRVGGEAFMWATV